MSETNQDYLNRGEPDGIPWAFENLQAGDFFAALCIPTVQTGITVYLNESTDEIDGPVIAVYLEAGGGAAGPLDIIPHGAAALAAGQCSVEYGTDGEPTVHTAAADAVTAIAVQVIPVQSFVDLLQADLKG